MTESQKPARHIKRGMIQAAIWKNPADNGTVFYTTTFERLYRDDQQKWQHTKGFSRDDLLLLAKVASLAQDAIFEMQEAEKSQNGPSNGSGGPPQAARSAASDAPRTHPAASGDQPPQARPGRARPSRFEESGISALRERLRNVWTGCCQNLATRPPLSYAACFDGR